MYKTIFLILLITLAGCEDNDGTKKLEDDLMSSVSEGVEELAKLANGDDSGFRAKLRELKSSFDSNDFSRALEASSYLDRLLDSQIISATVSVLSVYVEKGADKAVSSINTYLEKNTLNSSELKFLSELQDKLASLNKQEYAELAGNIVAGSIYVALESKMSHSGAIPGAIAGSITKAAIEEIF